MQNFARTKFFKTAKYYPFLDKVVKLLNKNVVFQYIKENKSHKIYAFKFLFQILKVCSNFERSNSVLKNTAVFIKDQKLSFVLVFVSQSNETLGKIYDLHCFTLRIFYL